MERVTKLVIIVAVSAIPFMAWRTMLFNQPFLSEAQYDFLDYDAQIVFSLGTILILSAFEMWSRLNHERTAY